MENKTWSLVDCPQGGTPNTSRWTFYFNETYASVVTHDTLQLIMSVVAADNLEVV